ncbi:hypothetical protein RQP46_000533 [Phenoliferia psychrophenolica]
MATSWWKNQLTGRRLVWNILFYVGHVAVFAYGWHKQASDPRLAALNGLKFSVWISRGAGLALGVDGLLLMLPVLRNVVRVVRPRLTWLAPLDENIWFHRQIAYSLLFFTIVHTTAHYVNMINVERTQVRKETAWGIMYTQPGAFTGHVMLVIMYTTAHHRIRAQCFEAFWYTHHLAFFFLLGLYTHATGCFVRGALPNEPVQCLGYGSWRWTIWAGIAYFIERVVREVRARRATRIVGVLMHPSGAMEIRFEKPSFKYKSGQWLFLCVPEVSKFQWHPFTISSAPDDPYISCHIRQGAANSADEGCTDRALGDRLGCTTAVAMESSKSAIGDEKTYGDAAFVDVSRALAAAGKMPTLRVDGPYGAPTEDVFKHEVAVLIGLGIGVTPFASILKNIWYMQQKNQLGALRRVEFIWTNRDTGSFEWFQTLLKNLENAQTDPNFLRISMYLTSKVSEDMIQNISINGSIRNAIETGEYLKGRESSLKTTVGVYYCGPSELAKTLKRKALATSSSSVQFSFQKEHFVGSFLYSQSTTAER